MRIEAMKDFLLFSRILQFGKAARILNMSQPNLSYRIQQIENEVGHKLVERCPKPHLTENGIRFVQYAESIVAQYDEMLKSFRYSSNSSKPPILFERPICFEQTWLELQEICRDFTDKCNIEIKFVETDSSFDDAILSETVDIGLALTTQLFIDEHSYDYGYVEFPISEYPEVRFYMHRDNPLAIKDVISKDDLKGKKIVLPLNIRFSVFDDTAKLYQDKENINFQIVHRQGSYQDIELSLKNDELAFSMQDLHIRDRSVDGSRIISRPAEKDDWATFPYFIFKKDNPNPSLKVFVDFLKSYKKNNGELQMIENEAS